MVSLDDTIMFEVFSVADLRSPAALPPIGLALDLDPGLRPERLGPRDPPGAPIASAAEALAAWRPAPRDAARDWYFFANRRTPPKGRATIQIAAPMPGRTPLHSVAFAYASRWFDREERLEQSVRLFGRLAQATGAFYGRAALGAMFDQRNLLIQMAQGHDDARVFPDFERELPDVYWLNFYGPAYLEQWGKRLDGLGVRRESVGGGLIVWATDAPTAVSEVTAITDYPFKGAFYAALGRDTFMSEAQQPGAKGEHVPTFDAHRRHVAR